MDHETGERMGYILAARHVQMSGFWAKRHELIAAHREAVLTTSTLLGAPAKCSAMPLSHSRSPRY